MESKAYSSYDRYYRLVRKTICRYLVGKASFTGEVIPNDLGPMFILCNHNTDFDFLLVSSVSETPLDFVATETMLRMGAVSKIAARKFKPILHDKGSSGTGTLKQIVSRIKDGRSVLLFPEGNRSFDGKTGEFSTAIGKIAKMVGATLVLYRLDGGYFTTPRWGKGLRKGKMSGKVTAVLSPKELAGTPAERLQSLIRERLMTDAYEEQKENPVPFRSRVKAEYLESLFFICPECKKTGTLSSKKDTLSCSCGYKLIMDEYGYLSDDDNVKHTITELFDDQKKYLAQIKENSSNEPLWTDQVQLSKLTFDHRIVEEKPATLFAFKDHIMINSEKLCHDQIVSIDIVQRNRLIIHVSNSDVRYEFTGKETFNAVKYRIWFGISSS
ncbi:MAG: 1-acyl-sn-glycerol-3-phosphate acyltransferase [Lachnospiraceae bacterium]|nr:1-acyl-sn-glycerol-3-phosphate acyltransferase [Lachnospiraceae bacterium]